MSPKEAALPGQTSKETKVSSGSDPPIGRGLQIASRKAAIPCYVSAPAARPQAAQRAAPADHSPVGRSRHSGDQMTDRALLHRTVTTLPCRWRASRTGPRSRWFTTWQCRAHEEPARALQRHKKGCSFFASCQWTVPMSIFQIILVAALIAVGRHSLRTCSFRSAQ